MRPAVLINEFVGPNDFAKWTEYGAEDGTGALVLNAAIGHQRIVLKWI